MWLIRTHERFLVHLVPSIPGRQMPCRSRMVTMDGFLSFSTIFQGLLGPLRSVASVRNSFSSRKRKDPSLACPVHFKAPAPQPKAFCWKGSSQQDKATSTSSKPRKIMSTDIFNIYQYNTLSYLPGALEIAFQTLEPGSF